jgi:Ala-tRNA(Pro) deacylase
MNDTYAILDTLGIAYEKFDHEPFFTCEQADVLYKTLEGGHSKNLFLRNNKGDAHYLVILQSDKRLDLKEFAGMVNESKMSMASPERLLKYLGVTPGSVSPFGLINDADHCVKVFVDNDLLKYEKLYYHPNVNTQTLGISKEDFLKFLQWTSNSVCFGNIP